jgi:phage terminase large subunit
MAGSGELEINLRVPPKLIPLYQPARYKAAYGGRGGAKSHFFAEMLIIRAFEKRIRAVCIREVQNTIKDSVKQLLEDKIAKFGLSDAFDIVRDEIRCRETGSIIIFRGMQSYNAENVKSLEDYDIAWVEEAQTLSDRSLRLLRPTIRAEHSELWFGWNPRFDSDPVDAFFRKVPPKNAIIVPVNWYDNPFFPAVLREEMEGDYERDPEMAEHVWGGGYEIISEAAYFARLIAKLEKAGHVGEFPHDPSLKVYTSWDIGVDDYTAIWFFQIRRDGMVNVIDYYEASGLGADECVQQALPEHLDNERERLARLAEIDRWRPWSYSAHFLPHDVKNREWGAGAKSRIQTLQELGLHNVRKGAATNPADRINASRELLPVCFFNQTPRVMLGLSRLRRYSRKKNDQLGTYLGPLHDDNSHGADAFGEFAINAGIRAAPPPDEKPKQLPGTVLLEGPPKPRDRTRIRL